MAEAMRGVQKATWRSVFVIKSGAFVSSEGATERLAPFAIDTDSVGSSSGIFSVVLAFAKAMISGASLIDALFVTPIVRLEVGSAKIIPCAVTFGCGDVVVLRIAICQRDTGCNSIVSGRRSIANGGVIEVLRVRHFIVIVAKMIVFSGGVERDVPLFCQPAVLLALINAAQSP